MDDIEQVIQVFSDTSVSCALCDKGAGLWSESEDWLAEQVNHLLEHGCRLLHVGQETSLDLEGRPSQRTTAVLGVVTE